MGNWYEERKAFQQPSRLNPGQKIHRDTNGITFVSSQNTIKNLTRISRVPHWDTKGVILSQGFNVNTSEYKQKFDERVIHDYQTKGDLRPIRKTASVGPEARDKDVHCHTSGAKDYRMMTDVNAEQQYIKSRFGVMQDLSSPVSPTSAPHSRTMLTIMASCSR